ncbi:peroxidase family protein [Roseomonas sp. CAU 1739]|uniref:peroxidase family protein n=1 Tax=Roseomonas sp. CAU 1739 TaxID=3140364 RepID=UPI00325A5D91
MGNWLGDRLLGAAGNIIDGWAWLSGEASAAAVNRIVASTRNRPHPWSSFADYTCWQGLTDRTYLARHLPPADLPVQPAPEAVRTLFARPDGQAQISRKSTCLFPAFAQYLTDGFLRTMPGQVDRTTSNHEIDMCTLYGRTPAQTRALRLKSAAPGQRGRLKSQMIGLEEFSPFLYLPGTKDLSDPEFQNLDPPLVDENLPVARRDTLFAVGGDRVNSTPFTAMMNTLFLREHNRVARELETRNPDWDDEHVFQVARNIIIPIFIKIVVEHYINHITPMPFSLRADPSIAWHAEWNRPNWMTVEFSLLYRWHSLMPDSMAWPAGPTAPARQIPIGAFLQDNAPLIEVGLDAAFSGASMQPAGKLGALNTAQPLLHIEDRAVAQARKNRLATYNDYRVAFGMDRVTRFDEMTGNPRIAEILEDLYGTPDNVEFYPGLMAENRVEDSPLPGLLLRMVAVDAFSQALTNPLLSEHVWNERTFTPWGFALIGATSKLGDILTRNVPHRGATPIEMTQASWRFTDSDS